MISADAAAIAAITSPERSIRADVSIDWDADGHSGSLDDQTPLLGEVTVGRQLSSDLPDAVRLVEGSAVAEANVDLVHSAVHLPAGDRLVRQTLSVANGAALATEAILPDLVLVRVGDYLIVVLSLNNSTTLVTPGVFYDVLSDVSDGAGLRTIVYGKYIQEPISTALYDTGIWDFGGTVAFTMAAIVFGPSYRGEPGFAGPIVGSGQAEAGTSTTHTTPTLTSDAPVSVYVSAFAFPTTSGTWTPPSGDTEQLDVRGTHASTNIAVEVNTSQSTPAGVVSKTATSSASTSTATATIVKLELAEQATEASNPVWLHSPFNARSPLGAKRKLGRPVTVDASIITDTGRQTIRRLTGFTSGLELSTDRTVAVTVLDNRELMHNKLALPPIVGSRLGLNASALVSYAFAVSGFSPGPVPRVFDTLGDLNDGQWYSITSAPWIPFHGSLAPMMATDWFDADGAAPDISAATSVNGVETSERPAFVPGPYALGAYARIISDVAYTVIRGAGLYAFPLVPWDSALPAWAVGYVEFWFRNDVATWPYPDTYPISIYQDDLVPNIKISVGIKHIDTGSPPTVARKPFVKLMNGATTVFEVIGNAITQDGEWHSVGIRLDLRSATKTVVFVVDGGADQSNTVSIGAHDISGGVDNNFTTLTSYLPISDLHIQASPTSALVAFRHIATPTADVIIDQSRLELEGVLDRDLYEAWDLVAQLAQAEQAVVLFDEAGVGQYRTRARMLESKMVDPQVELSTVDTIMNIAGQTIMDAVRNVVSMAYEHIEIVSEYVYSLAAPVHVSGLETLVIPVNFDAIVASYVPDVAYLTAEPTPATSYAIANTEADGSGTPFTTDYAVTFALRPNGTGTAEIINNNGGGLWITDLKLFGEATASQGSIAVAQQDDLSIAAYGQQPLDLSSSIWVQREVVAAELVGHVLGDTRMPTMTLTDVAIVGDPRLQIDDRVTLVDRDGLAIDGDWWVTGVKDTIANGGYGQTITARAALPVLEWDSTFYWDESMWGAP